MSQMIPQEDNDSLTYMTRLTHLPDGLLIPLLQQDKRFHKR